jgi:hypothetical protein
MPHHAACTQRALPCRAYSQAAHLLPCPGSSRRTPASGGGWHAAMMSTCCLAAHTPLPSDHARRQRHDGTSPTQTAANGLAPTGAERPAHLIGGHIDEAPDGASLAGRLQQHVRPIRVVHGERQTVAEAVVNVRLCGRGPSRGVSGMVDVMHCCGVHGGFRGTWGAAWLQKLLLQCANQVGVRQCCCAGCIHQPRQACPQVQSGPTRCLRPPAPQSA